MKIGIMQPYFMPYMGYWQLLKAVDRFVVYDNIEFSKKSWIRRNRILVNGKDKLFTLPLKKDSDYLNINERFLSSDYEKERNKILNSIRMSYQKAPFYDEVFPLINEIFNYHEKNLFLFIYNSIIEIMRYLKIETEMVVSSTINMNHNLKCEKRVIEICEKLGADNYINPIGGLNLYNRDEFTQHDIKLQFLKTDNIVYNQNIDDFIPNLSIIDIMMCNSVEGINKLLNKFELI